MNTVQSSLSFLVFALVWCRSSGLEGVPVEPESGLHGALAIDLDFGGARLVLHGSQAKRWRRGLLGLLLCYGEELRTAGLELQAFTHGPRGIEGPWRSPDSTTRTDRIARLRRRFRVGGLSRLGGARLHGP